MDYELLTKSHIKFHVMSIDKVKTKYELLKRVKVFIGDNVICDINNYDVLTKQLGMPYDTEMYLIGTIFHHQLPLYKINSGLRLEIELKNDCPPFILHNFCFKCYLEDPLIINNEPFELSFATERNYNFNHQLFKKESQFNALIPAYFKRFRNLYIYTDTEYKSFKAKIGCDEFKDVYSHLHDTSKVGINLSINFNTSTRNINETIYTFVKYQAVLKIDGDIFSISY